MDAICHSSRAAPLAESALTYAATPIMNVDILVSLDNGELTTILHSLYVEAAPG